MSTQGCRLGPQLGDLRGKLRGGLGGCVPFLAQGVGLPRPGEHDALQVPMQNGDLGLQEAHLLLPGYRRPLLLCAQGRRLGLQARNAALLLLEGGRGHLVAGSFQGRNLLPGHPRLTASHQKLRLERLHFRLATAVRAPAPGVQARPPRLHTRADAHGRDGPPTRRCRPERHHGRAVRGLGAVVLSDEARVADGRHGAAADRRGASRVGLAARRFAKEPPALQHRCQLRR
mmetsp:Transcript_22433/g.64487  ORF Transcript_22433/g.64487 Transcript_22433/m.64487 type:complete len:230 (+) Transcript_22433:607-1296(+)